MIPAQIKFKNRFFEKMQWNLNLMMCVFLIFEVF